MNSINLSVISDPVNPPRVRIASTCRESECCFTCVSPPRPVRTTYLGHDPQTFNCEILEVVQRNIFIRRRRIKIDYGRSSESAVFKKKNATEGKKRLLAGARRGRSPPSYFTRFESWSAPSGTCAPKFMSGSRLYRLETRTRRFEFFFPRPRRIARSFAFV